MAVRIRLTRVGATKRPAYRVIAIDKRRSRDGRALEILGYYDPLTEPATLHLEREKIQAWIGKGAQPSETVQKLLRQAESKPAATADTPKPRRATRSADAKPSRKSRAKAATTAEAPAVAADETSEVVPAEETVVVDDAGTAAAAAADATPAEAEEAAAPEHADVQNAVGDADSADAADAEKADA